MAQLPLLDHFSSLDDPRQRGKVVYPLPEIMLVILCATLAGAEDFVEIRQWGRQKLRFLRTILPFARGIPSHDTLNDVMNALPGGLFSEMFAAWVEGLREDAPDPVAPDVVAPDVVAIDGKTSRRAHDGKNPALHVVSAWAARQRLVLGQEATQAKSNEISAIPLLLERLQLTGALVTIDAMGTQTRIAEAILARGADYLLALKDNQKSLAEEVALFFDSPEASALPVHQTTDADHGRLEIRRHRVSHDVAWLNGDRAAPPQPRASRAFPASRPSPWSRPSPNVITRPPPPAASSCHPCHSTKGSSPAPSASTGTSITDCTGCWMCFLGKTIHWIVF